MDVKLKLRLRYVLQHLSTHTTAGASWNPPQSSFWFHSESSTRYSSMQRIHLTSLTAGNKDVTMLCLSSSSHHQPQRFVYPPAIPNPAIPPSFLQPRDLSQQPFSILQKPAREREREHIIIGSSSSLNYLFLCVMDFKINDCKRGMVLFIY